MISILRKFTILQRLILMLALAALGTLAFATFNIKEQYSNLETQKWLQNDGQLDTVLSIIDAHQHQVQQGQISLEQAKNEVAQLLTQAQYGNGGYFVIIGEANQVIATGANNLDAGTLLIDKSLLDLVQETRRNQKATTIREEQNPGINQAAEQLTEGRFYAPWQWTVITGASVTDIHDAMKTAIWHTFIIMMLISTPLFVLFMALNHSISSPLESAIKAMESIADGEGDLRARLDFSGKDEIARLAAAFNRFAIKISTLIKDIKPMGVELTNDAEALTAAVTTTHNSTERILEETESVASAINQMLATSQEMAKNTQQAADSTSKVTSQAKETQELMTLTLTQTEQLVDKLQIAESTTARLGTASSQIGSILDVIRSIAEQTNLLALNAAIEAARAGGHGRGFAVVADEVRALANRTQESTNEINKIINDIQTGIDDVTTSNRANQSLSESLQSSSRHAGLALEDILLLVAHINDMNTQLASATEEQTLVTEEINRNVGNISEQMQLAVNSNNRNSHAAQSLNDISGALSQALSRFQV